jgi:hypothetical protein
MTSSYTSPSSKRRVHFFEHVMVRPTHSFYDYSRREIQACWYTPEEREQIRQEASAAIRSLIRRERRKRQDSKASKMNNDHTISRRICTRGLEHVTKPANQWRKHIRLTAASAVFDELDRQIEEITTEQTNGILDHERIATIYSELTKGSQLEGYVIGLADYKAAYPDQQYVKKGDNKKKQVLLNSFFKAKTKTTSDCYDHCYRLREDKTVIESLSPLTKKKF